MWFGRRSPDSDLRNRHLAEQPASGVSGGLGHRYLLLHAPKVRLHVRERFIAVGLG
jgi:hypothetical protein